MTLPSDPAKTNIPAVDRTVAGPGRTAGKWFMRQLQLFTTAQLATMRDTTKRRNYSAEAEEFRREHQRHRVWGMTQRHARKLRSIYGHFPSDEELRAEWHGRSTAASEQAPSRPVVPPEATPSGPEQAEPEQTLQEQAETEQALPEQALPEQAEPEQAEPEQAEPEQALPEQAVPEQAVPEQAVPEQAVPETAVAELTAAVGTRSGPARYRGRWPAHRRRAGDSRARSTSCFARGSPCPQCCRRHRYRRSGDSRSRKLRPGCNGRGGLPGYWAL
ncbi:hypothetical protein ACFQS1_36800 [Paractinoplanes rhizophilus]|uniref:Uncharacterized protein n=1 Tax=Paractinoplanes rhizophilus TaxID=1416877 RepID=A0ABW2I405_9ACTN